AAVDQVVAVAAEEPVGALAADDGVVARPAVYRQVDQVGAQSGGVHAVIAAVGVEDQVLGRTDVQEEGGRVDAVEANAGAVGGDGEGLGDVAAVDLDGVVAGAALVEGAAVAGVPDHAVVARLAEDLVVAPAAGQDVVAGAAEQQVVAALAEQHVVARLTEELVVARAAGQGVVAGAAEEVGLWQRPVGLVQGDRVVAGLTEDLDQRHVGDRGCPAQNVDSPAVDEDPARRVPADGDRVVLSIAEDGKRARAGQEGGGDRREDPFGEGLDGRYETSVTGLLAARAGDRTRLPLQQTPQPG